MNQFTNPTKKSNQQNYHQSTNIQRIKSPLTCPQLPNPSLLTHQSPSLPRPPQSFSHPKIVFPTHPNHTKTHHHPFHDIQHQLLPSRSILTISSSHISVNPSTIVITLSSRNIVVYQMLILSHQCMR